MRYMGQNYEIETKLNKEDIYGDSSSISKILDKFEALHKSLYGFSIKGNIVELIQFNVTLVGKASKIPLEKIKKGKINAPIGRREVYFKGKGYMKTNIYQRDQISADFGVRGPVIIVEDDSTIVIPPDSELVVKDNGCILITND